MKTTILECVVGSTLHGTAVSDGLEDLDLMAVVVEDLKTFAGFNACDTWTSRTKPMGVRSESGDVDYVAYGLRKYLHLALKGNPSILLALFAGNEHTREITEAGRALRALAPQIISKQCYMPFRGYMRQQHERLLGLRGQRNVTRPELVEAYGYDTKYAAHVVRLGLQGRELLLTGRLSLPMREDERALCVKVRTGGFSLAEVSEQIIAAERALNEAYAASPLPERPATEAVETWMLKTYSAFWSPIAWSKSERDAADLALAAHREQFLSESPAALQAVCKCIFCARDILEGGDCQSEAQAAQCARAAGEAEYLSWFPVPPLCSICDEPGGRYRYVMSREHAACERCFIAWYEGAGTDRDSIRKSLGIDGVQASFAVGDIVRQYATPARVTWDDAEVVSVEPWGGLTVRDVKTGTTYGWSASRCELVRRTLGVMASDGSKR